MSTLNQKNPKKTPLLVAICFYQMGIVVCIQVFIYIVCIRIFKNQCLQILRLKNIYKIFLDLFSDPG